MNCSVTSQAPCNRLLDRFPPLAGIWRFATQTREWAEAFAPIHHSKSVGFGGVSVEFSSRMSSLLPFMCSLCLEACFLLRCYHCTFHTDILSVSACAAWFLSLLKFQSRIRAVCVFTVEWVIRFLLIPSLQMPFSYHISADHLPGKALMCFLSGLCPICPLFSYALFIILMITWGSRVTVVARHKQKYTIHGSNFEERFRRLCFPVLPFMQMPQFSRFTC